MEPSIEHTYRLFGHLWLESPEKYLPAEDLKTLRQLEPLILELENRHVPVPNFDLETNFKTFVELEQEVWRSLNVERPQEFLLRPSGTIHAPIACHLNNPTFYTSNPSAQEVYDISNPSICQVSKAGFSSGNAFIFDHIARRDLSEDVRLFYNDELITVHEDFMLSLRRAMTAKIEVCWGKEVCIRMKKLLKLAPLRLWGEFKDVELWLEFDHDNVIRIIVFANHPQYFMYSTGDRFRQTEGRKQDIILSVAAKMANLTIMQNFYEVHHKPSTYGRLKRHELELVKKLEADADTQLKAAFPTKYSDIELIAAKYTEARERLTMSQTIRAGSEQESQWRLNQFCEITQSLSRAATKVCEDELGYPIKRQDAALFVLKSRYWSHSSEWHDLPTPLVEWIQHQDGLKIDGKPISSTDELVTAYYLLRRRNDSYRINPQNPLDILLRVAFMAGCGRPDCGETFAQFIPTDPHREYKRASSARLQKSKNAEWSEYLLRSSAEEREGLRQVVEIICTSCKTQTLRDDAPRWTTENPARYVRPRRACKGCGKNLNQSASVVPAREPVTYWEPVDVSIPTISSSALSAMWSQLKAAGCDPTQYPRRPDIYWSKYNNLEKARMLQGGGSMTVTEVNVESTDDIKAEPKLPTGRRAYAKSRLRPRTVHSMLNE
ncbi:hypothetical protein TCE0_015r02557 [Talaromyces pinophilus]|uniref:Uncharacterized protein n=1 Tax=Talaromyces pinophilus TaxID=128442 RepID=A0A6V8H1Q9_TALPI|nr:hypothetical protein TCE0_015r02557 [Talaromyces pinophilus]